MIHAIGAAHAALRAKTKRSPEPAPFTVEQLQRRRLSNDHDEGRKQHGDGKLARERPPLMERHLARLEQRHAALEGELRKELSRPAPDFIRVSALKRQKLRIKDDVVRTTIAVPKAAE